MWTHRRTPYLASLLALVVVLLPAFAPAAAQDERQYRRLTRNIERGLNAPRTTDAELAEQIRQLTAWPNADTAEFLIDTVLTGIANSRRVDRSGLEPAVVETLQAIANQNEEAAAAINERTFDESLPATLRFRLIEAQLGGAANDAFFQRGLASENWATRVLLLNYLGQRGTINDETFGVLRECLFHEDRRVRHAAVLAVERLTAQARGRSERQIAGFDALIELLEREQSGLKRDVLHILRALTRRRFGEEATQWRTWLNAYREGEAPDIEEEEGPAATGEVRDYYEIEMPKKMIFVVDLSSSMASAERGQLENKEAIREQLERTGPRGYDWRHINTKFDLAKAELLRAINSLREPERRGERDRRSTDGSGPVGDGDEAFTIIAYADDAEAWRDTVVVASANNKRAAAQWATSSRGSRLTNMYAALDLAFRIAGEGREDGPVTTGGAAQPPQEAVESIFFLTDGFATTGKYHHNSPASESFRRLDADNRRTISWEEYLAVFDTTYMTAEDVRKSFDEHLDTNGNGEIEPEEFEAADNWFYAAQMENLVNEFTRRNEMLHMKIHCIGIGEHDTYSMVRLADRNNGEYVNLSGE